MQLLPTSSHYRYHNCASPPCLMVSNADPILRTSSPQPIRCRYNTRAYPPYALVSNASPICNAMSTQPSRCCCPTCASVSKACSIPNTVPTETLQLYTGFAFMLCYHAVQKSSVQKKVM